MQKRHKPMEKLQIICAKRAITHKHKAATNKILSHTNMHLELITSTKGGQILFSRGGEEEGNLQKAIFATNRFFSFKRASRFLSFFVIALDLSAECI